MKLVLVSSTTSSVWPAAGGGNQSVDDTPANNKRSAAHSTQTAAAGGTEHKLGTYMEQANGETGQMTTNGHTYLPYAIGASVFILVVVAVILAFIIVKRRRKAAEASSSIATPPQSQQPILKDNPPKFTDHLTPTRQQPLSPTILAVDDDIVDSGKIMSPGPAVSVAPALNGHPKMISSMDGIPAENCVVLPPLMRIKAKGLLERRGSNASLTIDVTPIVLETFHLSTPPKECSVMEYLMSAGNRMTRRQLRTFMKNTKALHQEFLDIPLNHSRKLDLPGCNNKNRYKSIWPNEETRVVLPGRCTKRLQHHRRSRSIPNDHSDHKATYQIDDQNNVISETPINRFTFSGMAESKFDQEQKRRQSEFGQQIRMDVDVADEDIEDGYINANYIRGYDGESHAYIAAQGPLPNTINDFWRMIWNEQCPCIVMMTRLQENNRVKCENYLPNPEAQYDEIHVTVKCVQSKIGYSVRDIQLQRGDEIRQIKHFWFTSWPDHKAPSSTAKQLIDLVDEVELERGRQSVVGPVVVHCSAGLGRSGCFIATSIGIRQLREENMVDILGTVCQLRIDRGGMIQTVEQYEFIHHALIHYECHHLPETPNSISAPPLTPLSANSFNSNSNNSTSDSRSSSKYELPAPI